MTLKLIDAHCHLEDEVFKDNRDDVLTAARTAGLAAFLTASIVPEQWPLSQSLAERHEGVYFALGVHPWYAKEEHRDALPRLREAPARGAKAIGEIGLDGKVDTPPMALQQEVFEAQLAIAREVDLPVVLHCRGAFEELFGALKRVGAPERGGIVHAFSGSVEIAERLLGHGLCVSMGGSLTYRNSRKRQRVLERVYPDSFVLETDSPDISPVEARGQGLPNTPANLLYNLKAAAETLGESPEAVAENTTRTAARIFDLDV